MKNKSYKNLIDGLLLLIVILLMVYILIGCELFFIFLVHIIFIRDKMSYNKKLVKLPPKREKVETIEILRQLSKSSNSLGELKGIAIFCRFWLYN